MKRPHRALPSFIENLKAVQKNRLRKKIGVARCTTGQYKGVLLYALEDTTAGFNGNLPTEQVSIYFQISKSTDFQFQEHTSGHYGGIRLTCDFVPLLGHIK